MFDSVLLIAKLLKRAEDVAFCDHDKHEMLSFSRGRFSMTTPQAVTPVQLRRTETRQRAGVPVATGSWQRASVMGSGWLTEEHQARGIEH